MTSSDDDRTGGLKRDIERIEALRDQGRLSEEEARRLIAVLRGEAPDEEVDAQPSEPTEPTERADREAPVAPAAPVAPVAPVSTAGSSSVVASAPADDLAGAWLVAEMLAADLVVESVAGVTEPRLRTPVDDARLEREGDGWRLRYRTDLASWSFFGSNRGPERIEVELPPEMGVDLDVKAGDVKLQGVSRVRGRMLAGDLEIDGAEHVDIDKKAGDLEVRMRPTSGTQRVIAKAGDVDVTLLGGSDVRVSADVKVGDLRVDGDALRGERSSKGVGHHYLGTVGSGTAELSLRLTAGSMRLRTKEG